MIPLAALLRAREGLPAVPDISASSASVSSSVSSSVSGAVAAAMTATAAGILP